MSSKRGRSNSNSSLTGGTGDVNPQYLSAFVTQSGNDVTTSATINIPIQRLPDSGRAQVMEVLKVYADFDSNAETDWGGELYLTTRQHGSTRVGFASPDVIAFFTITHTITVSGATKLAGPLVWNATDEAGHGVLVATDNMYLQIFTNNTGVVNEGVIKVLYRWKNVSLAEYIGIVQSQQ